MPAACGYGECLFSLLLGGLQGPLGDWDRWGSGHGCVGDRQLQPSTGAVLMQFRSEMLQGVEQQ